MSTSQNVDQASVMYIESYLDAMENIPGSVARVISRIHEIDIKRTKVASLIDAALQSYLKNPSENEKHKLLNKFLSLNVQLQSLSDSKICLAQAIYDQVEIKARQLDLQARNLGLQNGPSSSQSANNSSSSNNAHSSNSNSYSNTNGLASSSSRGALCNNSSSSYNGNQSMNKSDSINNSEIRSSTLTNSKDNGNKDASNSGQVSDSGKRTRRNAGNSHSNAAHSGNEDEDHEDEDSDENETSRNNTSSGNNNNSGNSGSNNTNGGHNNGNNNGNSKKDNSKEETNGGSGDEAVATSASTSNNTERPGKRGVSTKRNVKNTKKTNKRKSSNNYDDSVYNCVDPDEPTYCTCEQVSYGEMICCDNNECKLEWFHFSCVGLTSIPKGRWFCPDCRGDRSNIQKKS